MKRALAGLITICVLLALTGAAFGSGEGAATLYNQGNSFYTKGDFESALKNYRHALDQKVADPRLEQNIGSAYFKLGDVGRAIYHFERGLLLAPRDRDLRYDLDLAKQLRKDEMPEKPMGIASVFQTISGYFTVSEWIGILSVLFVMLGSGLFALLMVQGRAKPVLFWGCLGLVVLMLIPTPFAASSIYKSLFTQRGVILADSVNALSGPGKGQSEVFSAHGGTPCQILDRRMGYVRIFLPTGLNGWVPDASVGSIRF
jgi:tetratricopeptide (TPR) repeat protein